MFEIKQLDARFSHVVMMHFIPTSILKIFSSNKFYDELLDVNKF